MIICTTCGFHNDDGAEFCGQCGEFLEFTGHRLVDDAPAPPPPPPPLVEGRGGLVQRVKHAVGLDDEPGDRGGAAGGSVVAPAAAAASLAGSTVAPPPDGAQLAADADRARDEVRHAEASREKAAAVEAERVRRAQAEAANAEDVARRLAEAEARAGAGSPTATPPPPPGVPSGGPPSDPDGGDPPDVPSGPETVVIQSPPPRRPPTAPPAGVPPTGGSEGPTDGTTPDDIAALRAEAARADVARAEAETARREAEEARRQAEEAQTAAEEEAERTRRAAALVARRVTVQPAAPPPPTPTAPAAGSTGPTATPPGTPTPARESPGAVLPGEARRPPRPTTPAKPSRRIEPGDLICGHCGEGNDPERRFCRRCGTTLAEAAVARTPWWRRLIPRRRRKVVAAGERPGRTTGRGPGSGRPPKAGRRAKVLVAAAVATLVALTAFGPLRGPFDRALDRVRGVVAPEFEAVRPTSITASSATPDHQPGQAVDLGKNTYWSEGAEGAGEGQTLVLGFDEPTDLAKIGITSGASGDEFATQPRPERLRIVVVEGDDPGSESITLEDTQDFQRFDYEATGVRRLEIRIESVYPSSEGGQDCSLTEVELFREET